MLAAVVKCVVLRTAIRSCNCLGERSSVFMLLTEGMVF